MVRVVREHRGGSGDEGAVEKRLATDEAQAIVAVEGLETGEGRVDRKRSIEHRHRDADREFVSDRIEDVEDVLGVGHRARVRDAERGEVPARRDRGAASRFDRRRRHERIHEPPGGGFEEQAVRSTVGSGHHGAARRRFGITEHREHRVVDQHRVVIVLEADDRSVAARLEPRTIGKAAAPVGLQPAVTEEPRVGAVGGERRGPFGESTLEVGPTRAPGEIDLFHRGGGEHEVQMGVDESREEGSAVAFEDLTGLDRRAARLDRGDAAAGASDVDASAVDHHVPKPDRVATWIHRWWGVEVHRGIVRPRRTASGPPPRHRFETERS